MKSLTINPKRVNELEAAMLQQEQISCPVTHSFGPGTYIREVRIPAGTLAVGHHQNFEQMNIFLQGRVTIFMEDGSTKELKAPMVFVGKPGRKIGYVHEDMIWLNVYATDEKDVEKLEAKFLTKSDSWIQSVEAKNKIRLLQSSVDNQDYVTFLKETGFTEELVRRQSENTIDLTDLPLGNYKCKVAKSGIEGQGLFATGNIECGEIIAPARIKSKRTIAGRYTNHSITPNARMERGEGDDINLVATRFISGCHGGLDGEEITINYRESLSLTRKIGLGA